MFERLKRLYDEKKITKKQLENAVAKGWITKEELKEIAK